MSHNESEHGCVLRQDSRDLFPERYRSEGNESRKALDDLFVEAGRYQRSRDYLDLIRFVTRFRSYAPFNAMLVHIQMPGAQFVAPAGRWRRQYGRGIKSGERPLIILQPMGPVMFVFDVSQTEPLDESAPLPDEVTRPFAARMSWGPPPLEMTIANAVRDGVRVMRTKHGSQGAGRIARRADGGSQLVFQTSRRPKLEYRPVPHRFDLEISQDLDQPSAYATLAHELGHLYLGHLGTPNTNWWPDRRTLGAQEMEFEAESVSYLVCRRSGVTSGSTSYLAGYLKANRTVPAISLDQVLRAAGAIEEMGKRWLPARKETAK